MVGPGRIVKDYQSVPIVECGDPLVALPPQPFAFTTPQPYVALGAPYAGKSPWMLRGQVLAALQVAQKSLAAHQPGWRLKLFDAWRPVAVQAFMVWREFGLQAALTGRSLTAYRGSAELEAADPDLYATLARTVFMFWSMPSDDPLTPPPHSTGAALDLTLEDATGHEVDMGCPIDEMTERAYPDFFATATEPEMNACHESRRLLNQVMSAAGFSRHANEWWHFSLGDQMWARAHGATQAIYGRVE